MGIDKGAVLRFGFMLVVAGIITIVAKSAYAPALSNTVDIIGIIVGVGLIAVPAFRMIMDWKRT